MGARRRVDSWSRRGVAAVLALIYLLGMGGCMSETSEATVKQEMLTHLAETYGEQFEIAQFTPAGTGFTRDVYDSGYAFPSNRPDEKFEVQRATDAEGVVTFRDGYAYRVAERELMPKVNQAASAEFGDSRLALRIGSSASVSQYRLKDGSFDPETFFAAEGGAGASVRVFVSDAGFDRSDQAARVVRFADALAAQGFSGLSSTSIDVFYVPDAQLAAVDPSEFKASGFRETADSAAATHATFAEIQDGQPVYSKQGVYDNFDLAN